MLSTSIQIATIAAKSLIGGIVGYFTNDLAIQMLFKKRFGMGGVVIQTRMEFIENATDLVEEEVLTTGVLRAEIEKEAFKKALFPIIDDFIRIHLPATVAEGMTVGDLRAAAESYDRLACLLLQHAEPAIFEIVGHLAGEIELSELVSEKQTEHIARISSRHILDILQNRKRIERFLLKLYREFGERRPVDFVPPDFLERLGRTVADIAATGGDTLRTHFDGDIDRLFRFLCDQLRMEALCRDLSRSLTDKNWTERIGEERIEQLVSAVLKRLIALVQSEDGSALLRTLSRTLIAVAKDSGHTLFDLMPDRMSAKLEGFLYERLAELIRDVILWIEERRIDIETMINVSLADRNIVAKLIHSIGFSLAEIFNVVDLVKEYIDGEIDLNQLVDLQSREFVHLLKRNTFRDILEKLEERGVLTESSLAGVLRKSAVSLFGLMRSSFLLPYLRRMVAEFFPQEKMERLLTNTIYEHLPRLLKYRILYHDRFAQRMRSAVSEKVARFSSLAIGEIAERQCGNEGRFTLRDLPKARLDFAQSIIERRLARIVRKGVQSKSVASFMESRDSFRAALSKALDRLAASSKIRLLRLELIPLYRKTIGVKTDDSLMADIHRLIAEHLHILTKGSVKKISRANLLGLSVEQLTTVVENFIGRELKPITRFGAGLGLIAGAALSLLPGIRDMGAWVGLPSFSVTLALSALMFGLIGWGTNWLALKMIFRPYFAKRIFGRRIPLTPGVVSRNKTRFAAKMGKFVEDHLLRKSSIESMLHTNSDTVKSAIKNAVNRDDYGIVDRSIRNHKAELARRISGFVLTRMGSGSPLSVALVDMLVDRVQKLRPTAASFERVIPKPGQAIADQANELGGEILDWIFRDDIQKKRLSQLVPPAMLDVFESFMNRRISAWIDRLSEEYLTGKALPRILESFEKRFREFSDSSLADLIGTGRFDQIGSRIFGYIVRLFNDRDGASSISDYLLATLDREINPQRRFEELFDGKPMAFMKENINRLTHYFLNSALHYLQCNHARIAENIYRNLLQNADFLVAQAIRLGRDELFETIEDIAKYRLPQFFETHESSLQDLVHRQLYAIGRTRVGTVGTELDREKIKDLLLHSLANRELLRIGRLLIREPLQTLMREKAHSYLEAIGMDSIDKVAKLMQEELILIPAHLLRTALDGKGQMAVASARLAREVLAHIFSQTDIRRIFADTPQREARESLQAVLEVLMQSDSFGFFADGLRSKFLDAVQRDDTATLLDWDVLRNDIRQCMGRLVAQKETNNRIDAILTDLLEKVLPQLNGALDIATKNAVLDLTLEGLDRTFKGHISSILGAIDFGEIVEAQIDAMHPRKIESTFRKFAGRYFPKLINYGFTFGILFGFMMDALYLLLLHLAYG